MRIQKRKLPIIISTILLVVAGFSFASIKDVSSTDADPSTPPTHVRFNVVRPNWWEWEPNQLLIIGSSSDFNAGAKQIKDEGGGMNNWFRAGRSNAFYPVDYVADPFYSHGGEFNEYETNGILFYDIPLSELNGKYIALARIGTLNNDGWGEIHNLTAPQEFTATLAASILRIWANGEGIYVDGGGESKELEDPAVAKILTGYATCDSNTYNGYGAYAILNNLYDLETRTSSTQKLIDYANYGEYTTGKTSNYEEFLGVKILKMKSMYETSQSGASIITPHDTGNDTSNKIFALGSVLVSMSIISGLYFVKRKKVVN